MREIKLTLEVDGEEIFIHVVSFEVKQDTWLLPLIAQGILNEAMPRVREACNNYVARNVRTGGMASSTSGVATSQHLLKGD